MEQITFPNDETDVEAELNLWYLSTEEETLLIVEFTFKYKATKQDKDKEMLLEKYPKKLVLGASRFYKSLQKRNDIVDLDTTQTKTDFVYKKKCKS